MAATRTAAPERSARSDRGRNRGKPRQQVRVKNEHANTSAIRTILKAMARVGATPFRVIRGLIRGDRPLIIGVLAALVGAGLLLIGPVERYLDSQQRVERLAVTADILDREVAGLEQRIDDLHDPRHIELLAREQQGFIRPGEIPFRIVPPPVDQPNTFAPVRAPASEPSWYQQWWDTIQRWVGGDGQRDLPQ